MLVGAKSVVLHGREYLAADNRPAAGRMVPFLGSMLDRDGLESETFLDWPMVVPLVRAWPIDSLSGAVFSAGAEHDVGNALAALLAERCPGTTWDPPVRFWGPLRKYGFLHVTLAAPVDEATDQPMEMEVLADATRIGEFADPQEWLRSRRSTLPEYGMSTPADGPIEFAIRAATYSNISHPGVGVGFYL
jgi:hypothetical protein